MLFKKSVAVSDNSKRVLKFCFLHIQQCIFCLFSFNGHRNVQTIKDLTENDMAEIEEYSHRLPNILRQVVTSEKHRNVGESLKKLVELFFGIYSNGVGFKFPPGDRKLIISIAKIVSEKFSDEGFAYFQPSSTSRFDDNQLLPTPVGNLFRDDCASKRKIATRNVDDNNGAEEKAVSPNTLQEVPGKDKLNLLVKYLETSLRNKFTKKRNQLTPQNMNENPPDEIEVDFESVVSLLESTGSIPTKARQSNDGRKSASATIKCVCSKPATNIRVSFTFQKDTKDKINLIFNENFGQTTQNASITVNFEKNWSLSNYISHCKKAHNPSTSDKKGEYYYLWKKNFRH